VNDAARRFLFDELDVRGAVARLDANGSPSRGNPEPMTLKRRAH
jgi:hypothetical protein